MAHLRKGCKKCESLKEEPKFEVEIPPYSRIPTESEKVFCIDSALIEPKIEIQEEDAEINLEEGNKSASLNSSVLNTRTFPQSKPKGSTHSKINPFSKQNTNLTQPPNPGKRQNTSSNANSKIPPTKRLNVSASPTNASLPFLQKPSLPQPRASTKSPPSLSQPKASTKSPPSLSPLKPSTKCPPSLSPPMPFSASLSSPPPKASTNVPSLPPGWSWSRKGGPNVCYTSPQVEDQNIHSKIFKIWQIFVFDF